MDINTRRPIEGFIKGAPIYAKEVDKLEILPSPDTVQMVNDLSPINVSPSCSGKESSTRH
jgi:hypothetical protein